MLTRCFLFGVLFSAQQCQWHDTVVSCVCWTAMSCNSVAGVILHIAYILLATLLDTCYIVNPNFLQRMLTILQHFVNKIAVGLMFLVMGELQGKWHTVQ